MDSLGCKLSADGRRAAGEQPVLAYGGDYHCPRSGGGAEANALRLFVLCFVFVFCVGSNLKKYIDRDAKIHDHINSAQINGRPLQAMLHGKTSSLYQL